MACKWQSLITLNYLPYFPPAFSQYRYSLNRYLVLPASYQYEQMNHDLLRHRLQLLPKRNWFNGREINCNAG